MYLYGSGTDNDTHQTNVTAIANDAYRLVHPSEIRPYDDDWETTLDKNKNAALKKRIKKELQDDRHKKKDDRKGAIFTKFLEAYSLVTLQKQPFEQDSTGGGEIKRRTIDVDSAPQQNKRSTKDAAVNTDAPDVRPNDMAVHYGNNLTASSSSSSSQPVFSQPFMIFPGARILLYRHETDNMIMARVLQCRREFALLEYFLAGSPMVEWLPLSDYKFQVLRETTNLLPPPAMPTHRVMPAFCQTVQASAPPPMRPQPMLQRPFVVSQTSHPSRAFPPAAEKFGNHSINHAACDGTASTTASRSSTPSTSSFHVDEGMIYDPDDEDDGDGHELPMPPPNRKTFSTSTTGNHKAPSSSLPAVVEAETTRTAKTTTLSNTSNEMANRSKRNSLVNAQKVQLSRDDDASLTMPPPAQSSLTPTPPPGMVVPLISNPSTPRGGEGKSVVSQNGQTQEKRCLPGNHPLETNLISNTFTTIDAGHNHHQQPAVSSSKIRKTSNLNDGDARMTGKDFDASLHPTNRLPKAAMGKVKSTRLSKSNLDKDKARKRLSRAQTATQLTVDGFIRPSIELRQKRDGTYVAPKGRPPLGTVFNKQLGVYIRKEFGQGTYSGEDPDTATGNSGGNPNVPAPKSLAKKRAMKFVPSESRPVKKKSNTYQGVEIPVTAL